MIGYILNMGVRRTVFVGCLLLLTGHFSVRAQDAEIQLGPDEIGENQSWRITITIKNTRLRGYSEFPDIEGFRKRGTSTSSQTSMINGQISSSESVTMTYLPVAQGTVRVPPFTMKINDLTVDSPGKTVRVGPPVQAQQQNPFRNFFRSPLDDFFNETEPEYVDIREDAFFSLTTSKDEVYVGEPFTTTLAFYVANNNRAPMDFYNLSPQLQDILKKIRPGNCWEENFNIENIQGEYVTVSGKSYTRFKLYQATFYPLNTETIVFPSVGLEMIKYRVARNPTFFGQNRQEDFKTFYTKEKKVKVKQLPPHPLKDVVAVGNYRLDERISSLVVPTGQSVQYDFRIYGEGNISGIEKPILKKDSHFDFYEPNIRQNIHRQNGRVTGEKTFSYYLVPNDPGTYNFSDYFQWIFFNPEKGVYDTLRSTVAMEATGESKRNYAIESNETGTFYSKMEQADNTLQTASNHRWVTYGMNGFILVILGASAYLVLKKN